MIICPNCARENEDHYKFCLGCGTEISMAMAADPAARPAEPAPAPVPTAVPQLSGEATNQGSPPTRPTPVDFGELPPPPVAEGAEEDTHQTMRDGSAPKSGDDDLPFDLSMDDSMQSERPTVISDPPIPQPADLEAAIAAPMATPEPIRQAQVSAPPAPGDGRMCGSCGGVVPDGFKFCGVCGSRYEPNRAAPEAFVPKVQADAPSAARLVLIHPDGTEGDTFGLSMGETTVGRSHPHKLFSDDPFLSPKHATFYFVKGQLFVRDESSLNGVFLRIKAEVELFHWDMFRIGQQLLRFEEMSQVRPVMPGAGDGTTVMGSPVRGAWGRLSSVVAIDTSASVWTLRKQEEYMGRERGDFVFPEDGFVSGSHCKVATRDGRYFLQDLGSTNGTYLRIKGEGILTNGDLVLLGQQLFRITL